MDNNFHNTARIQQPNGRLARKVHLLRPGTDRLECRAAVTGTIIEADTTATTCAMCLKGAEKTARLLAAGTVR